MLQITKGDIFECNAYALVNPVNTVGYMGKGLAKQFKKRYPKNFDNYFINCKNQSFKVGSELIYTFEGNKCIINFPTKKNWRENSKIEYIKIGLKKLEELIKKEHIKSIAIPALGVGNGRLDWELVKKEINLFEKNLTNINIIVFEPNFPFGKIDLFIINTLIGCYKNKINKSEITPSSLQNLIYLGEIFNNSNYFKFENKKISPYSNVLKIKYEEIKKFSKSNNLKLNDLKNKIEITFTKKFLNKEKKSIVKGIEVYKKLIKINSINKSSNKKESYLSLIYNILFVINLQTIFINSEEIYNILISKKQMKIFTYQEFLLVINFLLENNILKESKTHKLKINKKYNI